MKNLPWKKQQIKKKTTYKRQFEDFKVDMTLFVLNPRETPRIASDQRAVTPIYQQKVSKTVKRSRFDTQRSQADLARKHMLEKHYN